MPSQLTFQLKGLYLSSNKYSEVPIGSLSVADNIVIDYPSVGRSRRGQEKILSISGNPKIDKLAVFQDVLHAFAAGSLYRNNAGTMTAYSGSVTPPPGYLNRYLEANEAFYFTTETGVKKIFESGGAIRDAGVPRALQPEVFLSATKPFTSGDVNTTNDLINITDHNFFTGIKVRFTTTGTLPTGLLVDTDYYLRRVNKDDISMHPTLADAQANTAKIDLTAAGSGSSSVVVQSQPFLANNRGVAYRVLFGYKDANEYLFRGSPSGRTTIKNSDGGERPAIMYIPIPGGIQAGDFIQIYRTIQFEGTPNDEMFLVAEIPITSGMVSASEIFFSDTVQDQFLGEALYTNQSQQGILASNDLPPIAKDIANYKGNQLYANTSRKQRILVQFNNTPELDQTITIGTETYTAKASENIASKHFQRFTTGTLAENVRDTVNSLARVINKGSALYYGYYLSIGDPEGLLLIEARSYATGQFTLLSTSEIITPSPGAGGIKSDSEARVNRVCVSKPSQPDAVPETQFLELGRPDMPIERIIALRDSVFVFKDDGIFRIVGDSYDNMRVSVFDLTVRILAPESAAVLENSIFLYSDAGVVMVADNGMSMIGNEIEQDVMKSSNNANFRLNTFGVVNDPDRRYMLFFPRDGGDTQASEAYVFNSLTRAWTRWKTPRSAGIVFRESYFAGIDSFTNSVIYQERRTYTNDDYSDEFFNSSIISVNRELGLLELVSADNGKLEDGMEIAQSRAKVRVLEAASNRVEFLTDFDFQINREFLPADVTGDTIQVVAHGYTTGQSFEFTGTLPDPLVSGTTYFIIVVDADNIQVASSKANADAGTQIALNDAGTGTMNILSGRCTVRQPIGVSIAWNPIFGDNPGTVKHFQDVSFVFGNSSFSEGEMFFRTGFSNSEETVPVDLGGAGSPWGLFPWGLVPWGNSSDGEKIVRSYVPLEKRRATWIYLGVRVDQPRADVQLKGVNLVLDETTENFR